MKYKTEAAQDEKELNWLIDLFKKEGVRSYLEIGSRYGGSLWRITNSLPTGSRVVAVDLPSGFGGRPDGKSVLQSCVADLISRSYQVDLIIGDSTKKDVVESVKDLGPFDALLIDGGHSLECVTADWNNYGPMAKIVAFHDIAWKSDDPKKVKLDVPLLWNKIKNNHRHVEYCMSENYQGFGVLWR